MPSAVALITSEFPERLLADLADRTHDRGGEREVRFYWREAEPLLPVIDGGTLRVIRWGSKDRRSSLPCTGWTWRESVERGAWAGFGCPTCPVVIPATYWFEKGVWTRITEGIRGVLVRAPGGDRVYVVCEPSTRYFKVMTRSDRMPTLVDEVI